LRPDPDVFLGGALPDQFQSFAQQIAQMSLFPGHDIPLGQNAELQHFGQKESIMFIIGILQSVVLLKEKFGDGL